MSDPAQLLADTAIKLDAAMDLLRQARSQMLTLTTTPPPPTGGAVPLPPAPAIIYDTALDIIELPVENATGQLEKFFGKATPIGDEYLAWFQFPTDQMRLYSRDGDRLSDRDKNGLDEHRCHRKIARRLEAALREIWDTLGPAEFQKQGWHVYGGCHAYRAKKLGSSLSVHAYAGAIDINPNENQLHSVGTTFSIRAVEIMERHGFLWGPRAWGMPGYGRTDKIYVDPMHFQFALPHRSKGSYYEVNGFPKHIRPWNP